MAHEQPHTTATASEEETSPSPSNSGAPLTPQESAQNFPSPELTKFRTITQDTLIKVQSGDQRGATTRIKDLETAWDDDQATLEPMDQNAWHALDGQVDAVLTALRAKTPDPAAETAVLQTLLQSLG